MSEGKIGEPPYWYLVIRAARYLKTAPWELLEQPAFWLYAALEAEGAEEKAEAWRSRQRI